MQRFDAYKNGPLMNLLLILDIVLLVMFALLYPAYGGYPMFFVFAAILIVPLSYLLLTRWPVQAYELTEKGILIVGKRETIPYESITDIRPILGNSFDMRLLQRMISRKEPYFFERKYCSTLIGISQGTLVCTKDRMGPYAIAYVLSPQDNDSFFKALKEKLAKMGLEMAAEKEKD